MVNFQIKSKIIHPVLSDKEIGFEIAKHLRARNAQNSFVEIEIVGSAFMKKLNSRFMKKNYPTDVLSFPLDEIPGETSFQGKHIGTIILCNDIIKSNAKKNARLEREEFAFVLRHGLDHLLGIHHN